MKEKNGFTLIELLAVIVILAIIALIATPIVLNLINKARLGAAKDSAYGIRKAAQLYYQSLMLDNVGGISKNITITFNNGNIESSVINTDAEYKLDGTIPSSGEIVINTDGEVNGSVAINGYGCGISSSGTITCDKYDKYDNGEVVYYNPVTNTKCDNYVAANSDTNYKGETTGSQNGCMKWYAFLDKGESSVKLILDHNTTAGNSWNDRTPEHPNGVNVAYEDSNIYPLVKDLITTSGWDRTLNPRIISAYEVAEIVGKDDFTNTSDWFYLDSKDPSNARSASNKSDYAWLFDNTGWTNWDCTSYGCNTNNTTNSAGYWTKTTYGQPSSSSIVWRVLRSGDLTRSDAFSTYNGLRPVITVSKSNL